MGMRLQNINITDDYCLENVEVYTKGFLTGYIFCTLLDKSTNRWHKTLYRIHDTENGDDYTLVSVDYGWELNDDNIIRKVEEELTKTAKEINIDFKELEQTQLSYSY